MSVSAASISVTSYSGFGANWCEANSSVAASGIVIPIGSCYAGSGFSAMGVTCTSTLWSATFYGSSSNCTGTTTAIGGAVGAAGCMLSPGGHSTSYITAVCSAASTVSVSIMAIVALFIAARSAM